MGIFAHRIYIDVGVCVIVIFFFFFQAEDGIRDHCVTGVQTCALPIYLMMGGGEHHQVPGGPVLLPGIQDLPRSRPRSEERRVGKECRYRWSPLHEKKKTLTECVIDHMNDLYGQRVTSSTVTNGSIY